MGVQVPSWDEYEALLSAHNNLVEAHTYLQGQVDQLRVEHDALATYVANMGSGGDPDPDPGRFPGDPGTGIYYGSSIEGGDPAAWEQQHGVTLPVFRSYLQGSESAVQMQQQAQRDVDNGRCPLMSTKLPGSWSQVAAGAYDGWLLDRFTALSNVGAPVWLCLHHEPRGDGPAADWVAMQQRARGVLDDSGVKNVALVGILNGYSFTVGEAAAYYHDVGTGVHIMGFDSYNPYVPGGNKKWKSVPDTFAPGVQITESWGYPTLVGEFGCREDPTQPGKAAQWIVDSYAFGLEHGFVAMSYFNSGQNSPDGTWELTGGRLQAFLTNVNASWATLV